MKHGGSELGQLGLKKEGSDRDYDTNDDRRRVFDNFAKEVLAKRNLSKDNDDK